MESVNSQSIIEEIAIFLDFNSIKIKILHILLEMRQKRNVKSKTEEKRIILSSMDKAEVKLKSEEISEKDSVMRF